MPGIIIDKSGPTSYEVRVGDQVWRRHSDQLLDASGAYTESQETQEKEAEAPVETPTLQPVMEPETELETPDSHPVVPPQIPAEEPIAELPSRYPHRERRPCDRYDPSFQ